MCKHTLAVQVDGQTVIEQCRREIHTQGSTVHARRLQVTIVVQETSAHAIGHLEVSLFSYVTASYTGIDFLGKSGLVDLVLPLGVGIAEGCHSIGIVAIVGHEEITEAIGTEHIDLLGNGLQRCRHVNVHTRLRACLTLLGGDQNHTV